jgi:hypothetical protein
VRTAFGRPRSSAANDASGLGWLLIIMLVGGLAVARLVAQASADPGIGTQLTRALGYGRPERMTVGHVVSATEAAAAEPASVAPSGVAPVAAPASEPAPAPAAGPTAAPNRFQIANTDGLGVVLHTAPSPDARVPRGLLEGTAVLVVERSGSDWARVRADNGQEGWVGAQYLVPSP